MASFRIVTNSAEANRKIRAIRSSMTKISMDETMARTAFIIHRRLVRMTPKRWTGNTRRSWRVNRRGNSKYNVTNRSKVMRFLEEGTKGSVASAGKMLFIPLTRKAAFAGARKIITANRAAAESGGTPPFVAGRDFVFRKRVKGIRARHIVRNYLPLANNLVVASIRQHIRKALSSVS